MELTGTYCPPLNFTVHFMDGTSEYQVKLVIDALEKVAASFHFVSESFDGEV